MEMKVLWYDEKSEVFLAYQAGKHPVYKFLFWQEEQLLLVASYGEEVASHDDLYLLGQRCGVCDGKKPDGAGNALLGKITEWCSYGLSIKTPETYREPIARALGLQVSHEH